MRLFTNEEELSMRKISWKLDALISIYESQHAMTQEEYNDTQKELLEIKTLKADLERLKIVTIETLDDCKLAYLKFEDDLKTDGFLTNELEFVTVAYDSEDYVISIEMIRKFLAINDYVSSYIDETIESLTQFDK